MSFKVVRVDVKGSARQESMSVADIVDFSFGLYANPDLRLGTKPNLSPWHIADNEVLNDAKKARQVRVVSIFHRHRALLPPRNKFGTRLLIEADKLHVNMTDDTLKYQGVFGDVLVVQMQQQPDDVVDSKHQPKPRIVDYTLAQFAKDMESWRPRKSMYGYMVETVFPLDACIPAIKLAFRIPNGDPRWIAYLRGFMAKEQIYASYEDYSQLRRHLIGAFLHLSEPGFRSAFDLTLTREHMQVQ